MSFFGFPKGPDGKVLVNDQTVAEALEILINQIYLLNLRVEEAYQTGITLEDVENGGN